MPGFGPRRGRIGQRKAAFAVGHNLFQAFRGQLVVIYLVKFDMHVFQRLAVLVAANAGDLHLCVGRRRGRLLFLFGVLPPESGLALAQSEDKQQHDQHCARAFCHFAALR